MNLPIEKKLVNEMQLRIARLQDSSIEALYNIDNKIVLHDGTAIWRCYSGNRFSDDLDLYAKTDDEVSLIRNDASFVLKRYGIGIEKVSAIDKSTIITVSDSDTKVKLEIGKTRKAIRPIEMAYERSNGTRISILTLSAEDLILEKMNTYESRRYSRDIYDIYHLSNFADASKLKAEVCDFLHDIIRPVDEGNLNSIVYVGVAPSFDNMVDSIRRHFCEIHK